MAGESIPAAAIGEGVDVVERHGTARAANRATWHHLVTRSRLPTAIPVVGPPWQCIGEAHAHSPGRCPHPSLQGASRRALRKASASRNRPRYHIPAPGRCRSMRSPPCWASSRRPREARRDRFFHFFEAKFANKKHNSSTHPQLPKFLQYEFMKRRKGTGR